MNRTTIIILEYIAIVVGSYFISQHHGWQMGLAVGLIAWALLPNK
jgi:hypothetical protein